MNYLLTCPKCSKSDNKMSWKQRGMFTEYQIQCLLCGHLVAENNQSKAIGAWNERNAQRETEDKVHERPLR